MWQGWWGCGLVLVFVLLLPGCVGLVLVAVFSAPGSFGFGLCVLLLMLVLVLLLPGSAGLVFSAVFSAPGSSGFVFVAVFSAPESTGFVGSFDFGRLGDALVSLPLVAEKDWKSFSVPRVLSDAGSNDLPPPPPPPRLWGRALSDMTLLSFSARWPRRRDSHTTKRTRDAPKQKTGTDIIFLKGARDYSTVVTLEGGMRKASVCAVSESCAPGHTHASTDILQSSAFVRVVPLSLLKSPRRRSSPYPRA